MSDAYYQQQAARRTRRLVLVAVIAVVIVAIILILRALLYDACTQSFDREPGSVVLAYVEAVGRGDMPAAQECWEHFAYFDLEAGCSEICLSKVYGAQYEVVDLTVGEPTTTSAGRARLPAQVTIACTEGGEAHQAEILLDSVAANLPWKHWAIVHSTFGGTVAEPWCE